MTACVFEALAGAWGDGAGGAARTRTAAATDACVGGNVLFSALATLTTTSVQDCCCDECEKKLKNFIQ
jgi:hypothetical protein